MGNAYARVRRLSSHPAFSYAGTDTQPLQCPVCGDLFGRIPEYNKHFMAHQPSREMASTWLSARSFKRLVGEEIFIQGESKREIMLSVD